MQVVCSSSKDRSSKIQLGENNLRLAPEGKGHRDFVRSGFPKLFSIMHQDLARKF